MKIMATVKKHLEQMSCAAGLPVRSPYTSLLQLEPQTPDYISFFKRLARRITRHMNDPRRREVPRPFAVTPHFEGRKLADILYGAAAGIEPVSGIENSNNPAGSRPEKVWLGYSGYGATSLSSFDF